VLMQIETSNMILKKNLQAQIAAFEEGLAIRKRMLALLQEGEGIEQPIRPRIKPWLLREYLEQFHPDGIALDEVPNALRDMGFMTKEKSPTTNWLRQLKPQLDFFVVADGWVKLRDNLPQLDEKYANGEENVGNAVPQEHLE